MRIHSVHACAGKLLISPRLMKDSNDSNKQNVQLHTFDLPPDKLVIFAARFSCGGWFV